MRPPVLIAEADEVVRAFLVCVLAAAGFRVAAVPGGAAALAQLSDPASEYAAAVLDCRMADLSGPAVVARVRPHRPRLPVVLVSGGGRPDGASELLGDPLVRFLAKPFSPSELVRVVSDLLAGRAEPDGRP